MKTFIKNKLTTKNKILLCVFMYSLIIFTITPIAGDDWGNYLVGKQGIISSLNNAINMYKTWEGRFVSRILIYFFTYHKYLWNLLNALLVTLLLSTMYKYLNKSSNKENLIIPILGLLLVNTSFSSQCYLWVAGNITYFIPAVITLAILTYIYKQDGILKNKIISLVLITISFIIPMFVENIGCAYVFGLFILLMYYYKKHKSISITITAMFILSAISILLMITSPGSQLRMELNQTFLNMNIFEKIIHNIPNFIKYTFSKNIFILIMMLIPINKYIYDYFKNKKYQKLIIIIFNIIPIITILENSIYMLPIGININYKGFLLTSNWYYIFYWIIFIIVYILSIFKYIKLKKDKEYIFILYMVALTSIGVMLLTPTWGERVTSLYIFVIILSTTKIVSEFNINTKKLKKLVLLLILILCINVTYSVANKIFDIRRNEMIIKQLDNKEEIYIYYHGLNTLWNYTPFEEYHINTFKKYYNINEETKLTVKFLSKTEYIKYLLTGKSQ